MSEEKSQPLSLPAPSDVQDTQKLEVGSTLRLDELGPMVVNSDGTLSRIANWQSMTDAERARTVRVLGARNQLRIAAEERKHQQADAGTNAEQSLSISQSSVDQAEKTGE